MLMDTLDGMPDLPETWTVREIARASGRSIEHVAMIVRSGLAPGYVPPSPGRPSRIPAPIARDLVLVLRHGVFSRQFVELMKADPAAAREGAEALERLVRAASEPGEEAPAA